MTTTVPEIANSPLPADVDRYAGKWVALRRGEVVAAAESFEALIENPAVRADDAFYRVPAAAACFY